MTSHRTQRVWNRRESPRRRLCPGGNARAWPGWHAPRVPVKEIKTETFSPFKMGLQSYSLRGLTEGGRPDLAKALAATKELGLHYWESTPPTCR